MSTPAASCPSPITRAVSYLHVNDVEDSVAFYKHFGFEDNNWYRSDDGTAVWAAVAAKSSDHRRAEIFLAKSSGPIAPEQQAILLYLYASDVKSLRNHLLNQGLHDGGKYCGQAGPNNGRRVVFEVQYPPYMTDGELRVVDPDGYVLLIGQYDG